MISVVVPVLNEERSLDALYAEIAAALEGRDELFEVVFVDDGSTDGSMEVLTRLNAETTNVIVVHLRRNFGKAAALQAGFLEARGDIVVTIDADLQDDPAEIPKLLAKLDEGFDLVSGWKTRRNDPFFRRLFSRWFNWGTAVVSGVKLHDVNCGLKAYRAEVLQGMRLYGELHRFIPVLASYRGFRIAEIPVNHRPAAARTLALRARALPAWVLRPVERDVHGPLPPPPAAPLRRPRPAHGCDRLHRPRSTSPSPGSGARRSATVRC